MTRHVTKLAAGAAMGALGSVAVATAPEPASAQQEFFTIGTGGLTGVYYPAGGGICRLVNRDTDMHGYRCAAESTGGSVFNLNTMRAGELDFGIVQSDWQYHAYNGSSTFAEDGAFEELRAVFSLHPEPLTLVARPDVDVDNWTDLEGMRVNVGNPGSGQRATVEELLDAKGWDMDHFSQTFELVADEMPRALCDNQFDAYFYVVGHPSGNIEEATSTCDAQLVNITGDAVDQLIEENPYYRTATIPGGTYPGNDEDTTTFGVGATLVSSTNTDSDIVYETVEAVFENFEEFQNFHPAFSVLEPESMAQDSLSAPLHEGAEEYYREAGLID